MFSCCTELSEKTGFPSIKEMSTYLNLVFQMFCLTMNIQELKFRVCVCPTEFRFTVYNGNTPIYSGEKLKQIPVSQIKGERFAFFLLTSVPCSSLISEFV